MPERRKAPRRNRVRTELRIGKSQIPSSGCRSVGALDEFICDFMAVCLQNFLHWVHFRKCLAVSYRFLGKPGRGEEELYQKNSTGGNRVC